MKSAPGSPIAVEVTTRGGKFVRGRTSTPAGTGLGLYIAERIVTDHGGQVDARSEQGHGATVSFSLPLTAAPAEPALA